MAGRVMGGSGGASQRPEADAADAAAAALMPVQVRSPGPASSPASASALAPAPAPAPAPARAVFRCRICDATGPFRTVRARELMFGSGEAFDYLLCLDCGCLQIAEIPADLARHYGAGFYAYRAPALRRGLAAALTRARNRHLAGRSSFVGRAVARLRPYAALASLRPLRLGPGARIVDVGCGAGELLMALRSAGFLNLLGVDPFIASDLALGGGLRVRRCGIEALAGDDAEAGTFDLVMFHHSLEHIEDPGAALRSAATLLAPGGRCLVRIPTVSSHAWRHYGADWCALDAPRHLALHSRDSIGRLARRCGFTVQRIVCDGNGYQFWGSEQFRRGIATMRPGSHDIAPAPGVFSHAELREFERAARRLNAAGDGDEIAVYLQRDAR